MSSEDERAPATIGSDALRAAVEYLLSLNDLADPRIRMLAQVTMQVLTEDDEDAE